MGNVKAAIENPASVKNPAARRVLEFAKPYWRQKIQQHEYERTAGIPAAAAIDTSGADTGLNVDSSTTKRKKSLKGRRGLMIGSGGSTGGTTGTGLNI